VPPRIIGALGRRDGRVLGGGVHQAVEGRVQPQVPEEARGGGVLALRGLSVGLGWVGLGWVGLG